MQQGVFQVGETVRGTVPSTLDSGVGAVLGGPNISFRVGQTNHKSGAYNDPTIVYAVNPYSDTVGLSSTYSATSSVLNVDVVFSVSGSSWISSMVISLQT